VRRRKFISASVKAASAVACMQAVPPSLHSLVLQQSATPNASPSNSPKPQLALTLDDPTLSLGSVLRWQDANGRILKAISSKNVRIALFVCGMRVDEADGAKMLAAWDQAGHSICNHS
jgi:hypothetical protein